jgi:hypothetical protein
MKFGNWTVRETGIVWQGEGFHRFVINRQQLLETVHEEGQGKMYQWILQATEEDWLTDDDLYDLNFAFVYAAAMAGPDFNYRIFDQTVAHQYELLDDEEDTEPF